VAIARFTDEIDEESHRVYVDDSSVSSDSIVLFGSAASRWISFGTPFSGPASA
jgi:hypothetical protein